MQTQYKVVSGVKWKSFTKISETVVKLVTASLLCDPGWLFIMDRLNEKGRGWLHPECRSGMSSGGIETQSSQSSSKVVGAHFSPVSCTPNVPLLTPKVGNKYPDTSQT